jgi:hypothetical protein
MIETEERLRRGLRAYADAVDVSRPAASSLLGADAVAPRRRRVLAWVAAIAAGSIAVGGVATATGVIPEPVRDAFEEFRTHEDRIHFSDLDRLERLAVVETEDGGHEELWYAPNESNEGGCIDHREVRPDGTDGPHSSHCVPDAYLDTERSRASLVQSFPEYAAGGSAVGRVPRGAVLVTIELSDGSTVTAVPQVKGWFIAPFSADLAPDTRPVRATATAADGSVLAEEPMCDLQLDDRCHD